MKILNSDISLEKFFKELRQSQSRLLLLDYDGTLSPFVLDRVNAFPYPKIMSYVKAISETNTRVVIVSGRKLDEIPRLLGLKKLPEIWGSHGFEKMASDGFITRLKIPEEIEKALEKARQFLHELEYSDKIETKHASISVHWRGETPEKANEIHNNIMKRWSELLTNPELHIKEFDGGVELKFSAFHKGDAVNEILKDTPENAVIAYLGDDLTDEDAFKVLKHRALCILVKKQERETLADLWIQPPEEVIGFLKKWIENTTN